MHRKTCFTADIDTAVKAVSSKRWCIREDCKVYASSVDNLDDTGKPGITLVIKNLGFQEPINRVADAL